MAEVLEEAPSFKLFGALIVGEHRRVQEEEQTAAVQQSAADESARRVAALPCPRCKSEETKFCYFNNYNVNQPRHLCKSCRRYWTAGGAIRDVPAKATARRGGVVARAARVDMAIGGVDFSGGVVGR